MNRREQMQQLEAAEKARQAAGGDLKTRVVAILKTIYDPEIPVNIYDLGLIYDIALFPDERRAQLKMTLTAPGCPVAQDFPGQVAEAVRQLPDFDEVAVELVWDPPWSQQRMSEAARLELGLL